VEPTPKERQLLREKELLGFYLTGHPLEKYQPLMRRLSCVSLSELSDRLESGIIRAAFVVESLSFKIASRSGRKFAILTISDGAGRFELPIWPDLYEEKPELLQENQLLYAVLEVTAEEGEVKLQCRWFDDLREASEEMVKACDDAYDRAQSGLKLSAMRKNRGAAVKKKKEEEQKPEVLHLQLDAVAVKLSHILELKNLFRDHPGKSPLQLGFWAGENHRGDLSIDATWGVEVTEELKSKLSRHPAVLKNWTEINS
jgi:DNA polymerase-3 subunit alpha